MNKYWMYIIDWNYIYDHYWMSMNYYFAFVINFIMPPLMILLAHSSLNQIILKMNSIIISYKSVIIMLEFVCV